MVNKIVLFYIDWDGEVGFQIMILMLFCSKSTVMGTITIGKFSEVS